MKRGRSGIVGPIETMRHPMQQDRMKTGIAEENLQTAFRGRVFAKDSVELFPDGGKHKTLYKLLTCQLNSDAANVPKLRLP